MEESDLERLVQLKRIAVHELENLRLLLNLTAKYNKNLKLLAMRQIGTLLFQLDLIEARILLAKNETITVYWNPSL